MKIGLFPSLFLLAVLFAGCQSPGVKELTRPLTDNPLTAAILNPGKLSPETLEFLREENLHDEYRRDPDAAIAELDRRLREDPSPKRRIALAELCLDKADSLARKRPADSLGYYLCAAETAYPEIVRGNPSPERDTLTTIYNHGTGRVVTILFEQKVAPNRTHTFAGPLRTYSLSLRKTESGHFDPAYIDELKAAEYLEVKGIDPRNVQSGIGAALVGYRRQTPERAAAQPFFATAGMAFPVTALLRFPESGNAVDVLLLDTAVRDHVRIDGRGFALSADFTAPLATLLEHKPKGNIGFKGLLRPEEYMGNMGLYELEPFRPDQIPLIMVHGLMSSPETWIEALNTLRADPVLRENYQLLVYSYPTGFPIGYNGASFRKWLAKYRDHYDPHRRLPAMRKTVLIGHSMGGLLSNMQIRDSGEQIHDLLFTRPLDELAIDETEKDSFRELIYFQANPDVRRTVFVASPHRGSEMADRPIGKLGTKLINLPVDILTGTPKTEPVDGMTELMQSFVENPPDSVMGLRAHWPMLETILELPVADHTTYHSIIGNHKSKPLKESSDMVVPYWSSHLEGAASEKVVKATHVTITPDPVAIEELRRILYLHIGRAYTPNPVAPAIAETPLQDQLKRRRSLRRKGFGR